MFKQNTFQNVLNIEVQHKYKATPFGCCNKLTKFFIGYHLDRQQQMKYFAMFGDKQLFTKHFSHLRKLQTSDSRLRNQDQSKQALYYVAVSSGR